MKVKVSYELSEEESCNDKVVEDLMGLFVTSFSNATFSPNTKTIYADVLAVRKENRIEILRKV